MELHGTNWSAFLDRRPRRRGAPTPEAALTAFFGSDIVWARRWAEQGCTAAAGPGLLLRTVVGALGCLLTAPLQRRLAGDPPPSDAPSSSSSSAAPPLLRHCLMLKPSGDGRELCTPYSVAAVAGAGQGWAHVHEHGYLCVRLGTTSKGACVFEYAHRLLLLAKHGPPQEGRECSHTCGNPTCLNVLHLAWESHADNCGRR